MQQRRPNGPQEVSFKQLVVHFAMGALLGTLGGLYLVFGNLPRVHQLFWGDAAPPAAIATFLAMCALTIAMGASLTGMIFSAIEAERATEPKRRPPRGGS